MSVSLAMATSSDCSSITLSDFSTGSAVDVYAAALQTTPDQISVTGVTCSTMSGPAKAALASRVSIELVVASLTSSSLETVRASVEQLPLALASSVAIGSTQLIVQASSVLRVSNSCDASCKTCFDSSPTSCSSCRAGFTLQAGVPSRCVAANTATGNSVPAPAFSTAALIGAVIGGAAVAGVVAGVIVRSARRASQRHSVSSLQHSLQQPGQQQQIAAVVPQQQSTTPLDAEEKSAERRIISDGGQVQLFDSFLGVSPYASRYRSKRTSATRGPKKSRRKSISGSKLQSPSRSHGDSEHEGGVGCEVPHAASVVATLSSTSQTISAESGQALATVCEPANRDNGASHGQSPTLSEEFGFPCIDDALSAISGTGASLATSPGSLKLPFEQHATFVPLRAGSVLDGSLATSSGTMFDQSRTSGPQLRKKKLKRKSIRRPSEMSAMTASSVMPGALFALPESPHGHSPAEIDHIGVSFVNMPMYK